MQPRWPSHGWANSKGIFFCKGSIYAGPEFDQSTECSAVQKGPAGDVV